MWTPDGGKEVFHWKCTEWGSVPVSGIRAGGIFLPRKDNQQTERAGESSGRGKD